jgi:hypothetical protein
MRFIRVDLPTPFRPTCKIKLHLVFAQEDPGWYKKEEDYVKREASGREKCGESRRYDKKFHTSAMRLSVSMPKLSILNCCLSDPRSQVS